MAVKRMRVFAGPNGSGKTTILNNLKNNNASLKISFGIYVNADDIEKELKDHKSIEFKYYKLKITTRQIQSFFKKSNLSPIKKDDVNFWKKINVVKNTLTIESSVIIDSYLAADIAEFLRQCLLKTGITFTYETVMSHPEKIKFLKKAQNRGYKVYLYYVTTEDPEININRVSIRVQQNGHHVNSETITKRYYKSLENLKSAIKNTYRTFLFDNSSKASAFIGEVTNGSAITLVDTTKVPMWLKKYVYSE